MFEAS